MAAEDIKLSESIKIKKSQVYVLLGILILVTVFFLKGSITGNSIEVDYQKVTIDMKNWAYDPNTINVKAGIPTRIYLSNNVQGCFRDLTIPDLKITKYLAGPDDYIEVTFKKGEYTFACSMFHGSGKIIAS